MNRPMMGMSPRLYLAGPMEFAHDHGLGWRAAVKPALDRNGISHIDPADPTRPVDVDYVRTFGIPTRDVAVELRVIREAQLNDHAKWLDIYDTIWKSNQRDIDACDALLVRLGERSNILPTQVGGTYREMFYASERGKPIFVWESSSLLSTGYYNGHLFHTVMRSGGGLFLHSELENLILRVLRDYAPYDVVEYA